MDFGLISKPVNWYDTDESRRDCNRGGSRNGCSNATYLKNLPWSRPTSESSDSPSPPRAKAGAPPPPPDPDAVKRETGQNNQSGIWAIPWLLTLHVWGIGSSLIICHSSFLSHYTQTLLSTKISFQNFVYVHNRKNAGYSHYIFPTCIKCRLFLLYSIHNKFL